MNTETESTETVRAFAERVIYDFPRYADNHVMYFERRVPYGCSAVPTLEGGDTAYWSDVKGRTYTGIMGSHNEVDTEDTERWQALLMIPMTGRGDYNNSSVYGRANMEYLLENFPDTFIVVGQSSHDGQQLALPMDGEISEALADTIAGLWEEGVELDSDATHRMEQEILEEDWKSWLESDFKSAVQKRLAEVFSLDIHEVDMDDYLEERLARRGLELRGLFESAMEASDTYPEFETSESCYIRDLETTVARFAVSNLIEGE